MLKFALIGCGRISTNHIKAATENQLEIVAVCDVIKDRMERLLEKHDLTKASIACYTDYQRMLDEMNPDFVAIATESGYHAEIAINCILKGVHVIIEKPIALSIADVDAIIAEAEKHKVKVSVCHQNRFNLSIQEMRKSLDAGRFGKLSHGSVHVRWSRNRNYYEQAPWRGTWEQDGGALMNQCIHGIDLLRWMLGDEVEEVYAQTARQFHDYIACEDLGVAVVKFKNGALGTIEGTTNVFPQNLEETLYLFGESGTVKIGGKSCNTIDFWQFQEEFAHDAEIQNGFYEETENVYGNGHTALYSDMIACIKNNHKPYVDALAGKRALEMVLAVYRSAATGLPVKFPLERCSTLDFIGRF